MPPSPGDHAILLRMSSTPFRTTAAPSALFTLRSSSSANQLEPRPALGMALRRSVAKTNLTLFEFIVATPGVELLEVTYGPSQAATMCALSHIDLLHRHRYTLQYTRMSPKHRNLALRGPQERRSASGAAPQTLQRTLASVRGQQAEAWLSIAEIYDNWRLVLSSELDPPLDLRNVASRLFKWAIARAQLPKSLRTYDLRHPFATLAFSAEGTRRSWRSGSGTPRRGSRSTSTRTCASRRKRTRHIRFKTPSSLRPSG